MLLNVATLVVPETETRMLPFAVGIEILLLPLEKEVGSVIPVNADPLPTKPVAVI